MTNDNVNITEIDVFDFPSFDEIAAVWESIKLRSNLTTEQAWDAIASSLALDFAFHAHFIAKSRWQ